MAAEKLEEPKSVVQLHGRQGAARQAPCSVSARTKVDTLCAVRKGRRRHACADSLELARASVRVSQQRAAQAAGVSRAQWVKYESGEHPIDAAALEALPELARVYYALRLSALDQGVVGPAAEQSLPRLVQAAGEIAAALEDSAISPAECPAVAKAARTLMAIAQRLLAVVEAGGSDSAGGPP